MKQYKYIIIALLATLSVTFMSCSDSYLDTNPTDKIPDVVASNSLENLYTGLNGIHRKMVAQYGSQGMGGEPGFIICRESLSDDMTWQTQSWHKGLLQWVDHQIPTSSYCYIPWEVYYAWVLNANFILQNVDQFEKENTELHHAIKGEALCFRAWSHLNLIQMYAQRYAAGEANTHLGIPYRKEPTMDEMARNTVAECYQWMNEDIDQAIQLLEGYVPEDINHFSQKVAYAIKARIALAQQDYATAAEAATKALDLSIKDGHALMTPDELMHGFSTITTSTKETVWAAMTKSDQTVYFYSFYAYMSWNFNASAIRSGVKAISQSTYDKMSETDLRRQWWDPAGSDKGLPTTAYVPYPYQNRKYRAKSNSDAVGDFAFMRIAELYLMKAEALARSGREAEAQAVLTAFAVTRDPEYKATNTGDALIEEIMTHRRIELWGEGFRWFDLKRLNLPLERIGTNWKKEFCGVDTVLVGDKRWQYAIPQKEMDANPLMEQNPL